MPYNVGCLNQLSNLNLGEMDVAFYQEKSYFKNTNKYDLAYMIQKYESTGLKYHQILASKMLFNGGEVAVQLNSFNEHFGVCLLEHLDFFKKVHFVGETKEISLRLKATLKALFPHMKFPSTFDFKIESQSVDAIYAVACHHYEESIRMYVMSEMNRILKNKGKLYLTHVTEGYDIAIEKLYKEFDPTYEIEEDRKAYVEETQLFLNHYFSNIEVNEFKSSMNITNADDLITHLLSENKYDKIKIMIARNGLSKFRSFLLTKIKNEGTIKLEKTVNLLTCYKEEIQLS